MRETVSEIDVSLVPRDRDGFRDYADVMLQTPAGAAALFVAALDIYNEDKDLAVYMLTYLRFLPELSPGELNIQLLQVLGKRNFYTKGYFKGALPENGYTPSSPYTVMVRDDGRKGLKKDLKTLYIGCGGTGTYRPITLKLQPIKKIRKLQGKRKLEDDLWYVEEYPSIMLEMQPVKESSGVS